MEAKWTETKTADKVETIINDIVDNQEGCPEEIKIKMRKYLVKNLTGLTLTQAYDWLKYKGAIK